MEIKDGEYFELEDGDFCAVIEVFMRFANEPDCIRLRVIKSCKGKYSKKSRIGKPYTYQYIGYLHNFKKRIKRKIGKEEVLELLFKNE